MRAAASGLVAVTFHQYIGHLLSRAIAEKIISPVSFRLLLYRLRSGSWSRNESLEDRSVTADTKNYYVYHTTMYKVF